MEDKIPSDVVELIIAVDLNPSDPEEPINVNDVKVHPKGEGPEGGADWRELCVQLCGLEGKPSDDELERACQEKIGGKMDKEMDELVEDKPDPFDRASKPKKSGGSPFGDRPKKKSGGFAAKSKVFGPEMPFDEDEEDEEE